MSDAPQVRSVHRLASSPGHTTDWPTWVAPDLVDACQRLGIERPWLHQIEAAEQARSGWHVAVATPTASGKSLSYLLPVLAATYSADTPAARPASGTAEVARGEEQEVRRPVTTPAAWREAIRRPRRPRTALYLAPTKALAHDQLRVCRDFGLSGWRVATVDGDTEMADRDWARDYASFILTNPDLLHYSMLPHHERWSAFFRSLAYVVIDEAHRYRGVFGAHVALVMRRLRRIAQHYGADPVFVLASATTQDPAASTAALIGVEASQVRVVGADSSRRGPVEVVLWDPAGSAEDDAALVMAELVRSGCQTMTFIGSRTMAELVALNAQRAAPGARIEAYRGGYLAADRRRLERALHDRLLDGVATTNAMELGVDISGLDAVVIAGYPGSRAVFWQQAGRAGRAGAAATVILIARRQPLDAYLFDHPELIFSSDPEASVIHPGNPYVLGPHLAAAAQELPLTRSDSDFFGVDLPELAERLVAAGVLRLRPHGWFWARSGRAVDLINLRNIGSSPVEIIEEVTGRVLGTVDTEAADRTVHPGAVYLHQGETYLTKELDLDSHEALVEECRPGYYTQPRTVTGLQVLTQSGSRRQGRGLVCFGEVLATSQVRSFLRRDAISGRVWDETPLDLPQRTLRTAAVWWTLPQSHPDDHSLTPAQTVGGVHAMEHLLVGMLGLFAPCDHTDVRGFSAALDADAGIPSVVVYDSQAGGSGFAERGFDVADAWAGAAWGRVVRCACAAGCPACIVSARCERANQALDKAAATVLLRLLCCEPAGESGTVMG